MEPSLGHSGVVILGERGHLWWQSYSRSVLRLLSRCSAYIHMSNPCMWLEEWPVRFEKWGNDKDTQELAKSWCGVPRNHLQGDWHSPRRLTLVSVDIEVCEIYVYVPKLLNELHLMGVTAISPRDRKHDCQLRIICPRYQTSYSTFFRLYYSL